MARGRRALNLLKDYEGIASMRGPSFRKAARIGSMGRNITRAPARLPILGDAFHSSLTHDLNKMGGGRISRIMSAKKGKYIAGAIAAAGGVGELRNRRSSGLDRVSGRPTGPYVY